VSEEEGDRLLSQFQKLSKEVGDLAKRLHNQFILLTSDNGGLLSTLSEQWGRVRPVAAAELGQEDVGTPMEATDSVFVDDGRALLLYEAIKKIGNPEAIGSEHYPMTWNDIINAGFRESKDFGAKGILCLEDLQKFINSLNLSAEVTSSE